MGNKIKPRCCGCGAEAVGRICYLGNDEQVIDNPFCKDDESDIWEQTIKWLQGKYGDEKGMWIVIQRWHDWERTLPAIPLNAEELFKQGIVRKRLAV